MLCILIKHRSPPYISHKIKFEGTIHSFKREIVETSRKEVPKVSLASVRIHVTDLELISSRIAGRVGRNNPA